MSAAKASTDPPALQFPKNSDTCCDLTEGEAVGLDARIEELDLESPVPNIARLADQLVDPLIIRSALALTVDVGSMGGAWGLAIGQHAKPHRTGTYAQSHHV